MPKAESERPSETNWLHQFDGITRFHYANQRKLAAMSTYRKFWGLKWYTCIWQTQSWYHLSTWWWL